MKSRHCYYCIWSHQIKILYSTYKFVENIIRSKECFRLALAVFLPTFFITSTYNNASLTRSIL